MAQVKKQERATEHVVLTPTNKARLVGVRDRVDSITSLDKAFEYVWGVYVSTMKALKGRSVR